MPQSAGNRISRLIQNRIRGLSIGEKNLGSKILWHCILLKDFTPVKAKGALSGE
jgi:hypothetical protein